jgi:twitching motility protein PilT
MHAERASDLFLRADMPPSFRVDGRVVRGALPAPTSRAMERYRDEILTPLARERFQSSPDVDIAYTLPGVGRFRVNLFLHGGALGLVARAIPDGAIEFGPLNLPPVIREFAEARRGLVLIVGPTGCGKSTTLAAILHQINQTRDDHIITIEDPIEFVHEGARALIHQRQVGYDTASFATALRHIVRQSPDVVLIGEMRDQETVETALSAALTGHLVLSTLHTTNAVQSIDRILNYFPPEARRQAQVDLAITLVGIVSMRLVPVAAGPGRYPAVEILRGTPTVRRLITEGSLSELYEAMRRGAPDGMSTLTQSLAALVRAGRVDARAAMSHAPNPDELRLNLEGMFTGIESIERRVEEPA